MVAVSVLSLILYSAVFVPLERWFARLPEQTLFRETLRTDFSYFFVSAILVQVTTLLTLRPAMLLFDWARVTTVHAWVQASPGVVQFGLMVLVSCTIRPSRWIGSPGRGCTSSTSL